MEARVRGGQPAGAAIADYTEPIREGRGKEREQDEQVKREQCVVLLRERLESLGSEPRDGGGEEEQLLALPGVERRDVAPEVAHGRGGSRVAAVDRVPLPIRHADLSDYDRGQRHGA